MNYSYTINSIDAQSIDVTYLRRGYDAKRERLAFNDGQIGNNVDAARIHQLITRRAPHSYWQRVDKLNGNSVVDSLQSLVGQTFQHPPA